MFKKQKKQPENRRVVRMSSQGYNPYASSPRRSAQDAASSGSSQVRRRPDDQQRGVAQEERDTKIKKHALRRRIVLLASAGAMTLLAASVLYLGSSPKVVISQTGDKAPILLHSQADYQAAAQQLAQKSLANYNKITIDSNAIEQALREQFPELASVRVQVPIVGTRPTVVVAPREPVAVLQPSRGGTFVIDAGGTAIKQGQAPDGMDLPAIIDQTGSEAVLGRQVLPSTTLGLINKQAYQLAQKNIAIESFILPAQAAQEVDLRVAGLPYYIKFSTASPTTFDEQIGSFLAMRDYLSGKGITPKEYVDVRIPGRAYYK